MSLNHPDLQSTNFINGMVYSNCNYLDKLELPEYLIYQLVNGGNCSQEPTIMDANNLSFPYRCILTCTPWGGIWKGWPNPPIWNWAKGCDGIPPMVVDIGICGGLIPCGGLLP